MTNPTPRKPSKVTITPCEGGFDAVVQIFEVSTETPPDLQEAIDRRKRERREQREREMGENGAKSPESEGKL